MRKASSHVFLFVAGSATVLCRSPCPIRIIRLVVIFLFLFASLADLLLYARFLDHPVENEVIFVAHAIEEVLEKFAQVANVRLFVKFERAAVVQIDAKLFGQLLYKGLH